jgi:hypothetical protein
MVAALNDDRATRIADVIIAWNVFRHFYPYFDIHQDGLGRHPAGCPAKGCGTQGRWRVP